MQTRTTVVATVLMEGFHCWEGAPPAVDFLRARHRHVFHIKAHSLVKHDDRDVEFILLGRDIQAYLEGAYGMPMELGSMSCEMLARQLLAEFELELCEVWEDGENGAVVERA